MIDKQLKCLCHLLNLIMIVITLLPGRGPSHLSNTRDSQNNDGAKVRDHKQSWSGQVIKPALINQEITMYEPVTQKQKNPKSKQSKILKCPRS